MPNININISDNLMRAVKIACATSGLTQKEWVRDALARESGLGAKGAAQGPGQREASPHIHAAAISGHDASNCRVYRCGMCAAIKGG